MAQKRTALWIADVRERWTAGATKRFLQSLPEAYRVRVHRYRRWIDMQMSVTGLLMIGTVMQRVFGDEVEAVLSHLTRSSNGRPSLPCGPDFNLAHSGGIVILAVAEKASGIRVGIDIEVISDAWTELLNEVLTPREFAGLATKDKPADEFYRIWTYKEAVLKADGRGLAFRLNRISSLGPTVPLDGRRWSVKRLAVPSGYEAHLAASRDTAVRQRNFHLHDGAFDCT